MITGKKKKLKESEKPGRLVSRMLMKTISIQLLLEDTLRGAQWPAKGPKVFLSLSRKNGRVEKQAKGTKRLG